MKKPLLSFLLFVLCTAFGTAALAGTSFSYSPSSSYLAGSSMTLSPTVGTIPATLSYTTPGAAYSATNLSKPYGMAFDASNDLFVVNSSAGTVTEYLSGSTTGTNIITGITNPTSIAIDASNNIYLGNYNSGSFTGNVYKYSLVGGVYTAQTFTLSNSPSSVYGMCVDVAGNIYIADYQGSAVYKYSSGGTLLLTSNYTSNAVGVQVDATGNIYLLDLSAKSIIELNSVGTYIATPVTGLSTGPYGFYMDASQNFYVANTGGGNIRVYNSIGTLVTSVTPTSGTKPRGVIVDKAGNLYEDDYVANVLYKYTPVGGYFISSGTLPAGLTFNSVNGTISGTPTIAGSYPLTVIGYPSNGTSSTSSFTLVVQAKPTVVYSPSSYTYSTGTTGINITPTVTGSPTSFAYTGTLPGGLTFSTTTGAVTGTATTATAATTITVTATNTVGTSPSTTLTITVTAPPTITYTTPNNYVVGTAIPTLSPTVGGGTPAAPGYGTTGTPLTTTGTAPWGMAVDPSGNIYTANYTSGTISKYTAAGVYSGSFITSGPTLTNPTGITFDPSGNAYVVLSSGAVYKYSSSGAYISTILATGTGTSNGIAVDQSGNVFWTDYTTGAVNKYTASTGVVTAAFINLGGAYGPSDVQVDNAGNIYVIDRANTKKIYKYNSAGIQTATLAPTFTTPYGMFVDPSGNIFVGDSGPGKAYEYSSTGTLLATFTTGANPRGLVADAKGNLYIDDETSGAILKFAPAGGYYISSPVPPGLAFNNTNGYITGTPTIAFSSTYTVTAYSGSAISGTSSPFVINCAAAPTVVYSPSSYTYATGTTGINITPTVTGSPTSFAYTGTLPGGLTFSTTTGAVTGTATTATAATTITVTATNTVGTSPSTTLTITVTAPPTITYTTPNNYVVGTAIPTLSPTVGGGTPAAPGYGTTGTPLTTTGTAPWGMAVDPSGNIYTANYTSGTISKYTAAGVYSGSFITSGPTLTNPTGITFDPSGNAYVVLSSGAVYKYSSSGAYISTILATGTGTSNGIAVDQSGNVFWTDYTTGAVNKYTASTGVVTAAFINLGGAYGPSDVQVDNAGNIYVIDRANTKKIYKYNSAGIQTATLAPTFTTPYGMFVDPSGNIFVGDSGPGKAYEYSSTGTLLATFTTGANPRGLVADAKGNLYIDDETSGAILKFAPAGGYYISSPVPPGLAFNNTNGYITGTPTIAFSSTYTVTAYSGSAISGTSSPFVINCAAAPTVVYSPSSYTYATGTTGINITPTVTGSPTSFAYTGTLPGGLTFSTTTGAVTGTATTATAATTITVTATNTVGTSPSTTLTITVTAPPTITYTTPNNYVVGTAIPTLSPTVGGGTPAAPGYGTTGTPLTTTGTAPWGMAVDPSGNIYTANYTSGTISKYTAAGVYSGSFITSGPTLTNPTGITFDPSGNAYVVLSSGAVYKYSSSGAYISTILATGTGTSNGIAVDQSGNVFWTDYTTGAVNKYTASTGVVTAAFINLGGAYGPSDVQVDNAGNIYVIDRANTKKIYKYNSAGIQTATLAPTFTTPYGMFVDPSGNIFVGDSGPGKAYEYSSTGTLLATFTTGANPRGLVADAKGNLYIDDETSGAILKFAPAGGYYISSPVPPGLAFNNTNGYITGTPTIAFSSTYTVTAYSGSAISGTSSPFVINCNTPPIVVYQPNAYNYAVGASVTITPIITGTSGSFAYTGTLPAGLTFSTSTGVVSGTPTTVTAATTIMVTGTNIYGTGPAASLTITITTPPVIAYSPSTNIYTVGTAITPLTPTNSGGAVGAAGFGTAVVFAAPTTPTNLNGPLGIGRDGSGNIYIADSKNGLIRKYSPSGQFTSNFGTGFPSGFSPIGITFDSSGNGYVLNGGANSSTATGDGLVYKISSTGAIITTLNPTGATGGFDNGTQITIDASNNIYVSDLYKPSGTFTGYVTKFSTAGTSISTYTVTNGGNASGVAVDASGNVYVTDNINSAIDKFATTTAFTTFGSSVTGPFSIATDAQGNVYVADPSNNDLVQFDQTGNIVSTITSLTNPKGVYVDPSGNLYITDYTNNTLTEYPITGGYYISPGLPSGLSFNHTTGTISGTPYVASSATNYTVTAYDAVGNGTTTINLTCIIKPVVFSYTPASNAYPINAAIAPLSPVNTGGGVVTTGFGTGVAFGPGVGSNSAVAAPWGMAIDASNNVFVIGYSGKIITEYSPTGTILTSFATAFKATGVALDGAGNAYVIMTNGKIYQYVISTGVGTLLSSTIFNNDFNSNTTTGSGYGIAIDASNNLFVTDNYSGTVYKCSTTSATAAAFTTTNLASPSGITVDALGNVYVIDQYYGKLQKYNSSGTFISSILTGLGNKCYGLLLDAAGNFYIGSSSATSGQGSVNIYNSAGIFLNAVSGFTDPRGLLTDSQGDLYVSDFVKATVTKYPPQNGYNITAGGSLPPGILFSHATGTFSGTPTAVFGPVTYTITAYGYDGTSATANETIRCFIGYDWIGTTSSDWNVNTNWISKIVPLGGASNNTANIGVNYAFTNQPSIGSPDPTTISVGAIVIGNKGGQAVKLTVNAGYTLAVTSDITKQSDANSNLGYVSTLAGGGNIIAANVNVVANSTAATAYTESLTSSVTSLKLTGNIALKDTTYNAAFYVSNGITSVTGTLLTTNVSGSTSTFNVGAVSPATAATLQLANVNALSTLATTGTNVLSFANTGATIEYSGAAQTVYTDASISGLSTGLTYQNIKFSGTGIKTLNGTPINNLNITGNFTNALPNDAADYVSLKNTIVNFNGTAAQALAGGTASINYGNVFNTVNFSNAGTKTMSGAFYVASTGTLNMSNSATLVAGDNVAPTPIAADAYLTLLSDVNGAATVPAIPSGCAINGNVNVQRYITGGSSTYRGYRMLSSPVNAGGGIFTINYLIKQVYLTGTSGTGGGFDGGSNPSLYLFRENLLPNNSTFTGGNFRGFNNITAAPTYTIDVDGTGFQIPTGNGYQMFYRGDRKAAVYSAETTPSYVPTADTLTATGYLNQGAITVKNWYDNSQSLLYSTTSQSTNIEGYNLLGNPYASSINFDTYSTTSAGAGIYAPGTNPFVYILDPVSKNYNVYQAGNGGMGTIAATGSNIIASGEGFFIVANTAGATLTFNEAAKISSQATTAGGNLFLALQQNQTPAEKSYLRLELNKDTINRDAIFINFNTGANAKYAGNEDAPYKVGHGYVSLASRSADGISLAINTTPYPKQNQPIPLNVSAYISGSYTLKMTDRHNMPDMYDIWLKDAYLKDSLDIKHNSTYTFDVNTSDTGSYGNNRFSLIIRQDPALALHLLNFTASKAAGTVQTAWTVENEADYTKFSLLKSTDGVTFSGIDSLLSSGIGTYSFADVKPQVQNYYKLQLTDLAGNITYSAIVPVLYSNTSKPVNGLTVYPNPTNSMINIAVNQGTIATSGLQNQTVPTAAPTSGQTYDIKITNMTGEVLKTVTAVSATWQNNVSSLLPGTYIIQVFSHGSSSVVGRTTFVKL